MSQALIVRQETFTIEHMIAAWLDAKTKRTGSTKTARAYQDTIEQFRAALHHTGYDLDSDERLVSLAAQGWAGLSTEGQPVAAATYNQRLAIISSFYKYALKQRMLTHNPIDLVERMPKQTKDAALPLEADEVKERLSAIYRTTQEGLRDYALISLLLATGRRVNEVASLRLRDLTFTGKRITVTWQRCKGNKQMIDKLSPRTTQALVACLHAVYGPSLLTLPADTPLFVSCSRQNKGQAVSGQTIADICERRLGTSKVHALRHTFAVGMEQTGASLSEIGARLGHNDLKTTSDYMKRLHSAENKYASRLDDLFGI